MKDVTKKRLGKIGKAIYFFALIGIITFGLWGFYKAEAWTDGSSTPPVPNVAAPINVGPNAQTKDGALTVMGGLTLNHASNYHGLTFKVNGVVEGSIIQESTGNIYIDAVKDILLRPGGNVGIGTSSPTELLTIGSVGASPARKAILLNNGGYGNYTNSGSKSDGDKLVLYDGSGFTARIGLDGNLGIWNVVNTNTNTPVFRVASGLQGSSASDKLVVLRDGNVGIGTTTPSYKLEVVGGPIKAAGGLIIETRTSDPASPATGQMWLRTD